MRPDAARPDGRHGSSAVPLALAYAALIVYASLYPFEGWRWPIPPVSPPDVRAPWLGLPWWPVSDRFDVLANLAGYVPMGALAYFAAVRSGWRPAAGAALAMLSPSLMSFALEHAQSLLPDRVPSVLDWLRNSAGGVIGAVLAAVTQALGLIDRWQSARDRWFLRRSGGALALMLVWPMGLLFPPPLPFGMGPAWDRLLETLAQAVEGVAWTQPLSRWIAARPPAWEAMDPAAEWLAIVLGLLAPMLLAGSVTRPGWRRVVLAVGAAVMGVAATTLSNALNLGPPHALAWLTPAVGPAMAAALALACVLALAPHRVCAALALASLSAGVALVAQAPADPYLAQSLQGWEQGRFIRFHGLAQWVGWLWPFVAMGWLLMRIGARHDD
jgi:VanZ family protein